jgi:excisionase family DNA binding protein
MVKAITEKINADSRIVSNTLYTVSELAGELNIALRTVYIYVKSGRLKGTKIGRDAGGSPGQMPRNL